MKRLAVLFALAAGTSGCATQLTNRQLAGYVVPVGIVVGAIALATFSGGCRSGCDLSGSTTR